MNALLGMLGGAMIMISFWWLYGVWPFRSASRWGYLLLGLSFVMIMLRSGDPLVNFLSFVICCLIGYAFVRLDLAIEIKREARRFWDNEDRWR